ncbi:MAG: hypothetical protein ACKO7W_14700 [Elainella sp.]
MTLLRLLRPLIVGSGLTLLTALQPVTAQPTLAQLTLAQTLTAQATQPSDSSHAAAVQRLVRDTVLVPENLEQMYAMATQEAATAFQVTIQPGLGRELTEAEIQRLYQFWDRKVREIMPYEVLAQALVPIFTRLLTPADLELLNGPPTRAAEARMAELAPQLFSEATNAGQQIAQGYVSDSVWMNNTLEELRNEFPHWFASY